MNSFHSVLVFLACLYQANAVILSGKCHDDPIISTFDANQVKLILLFLEIKTFMSKMPF